jgi:hypothetical protein
MAARAGGLIREEYAAEFANADDPNLVQVDPNVGTNDAGEYLVTWTVNNKLFRSCGGVTVAIRNVRG